MRPNPAYLDAGGLPTELGWADEWGRVSRANRAFLKSGIAIIRRDFYGLRPGYAPRSVAVGNDEQSVLLLL